MEPAHSSVYCDLDLQEVAMLQEFPKPPFPTSSSPCPGYDRRACAPRARPWGGELQGLGRLLGQEGDHHRRRQWHRPGSDPGLCAKGADVLISYLNEHEDAA